MGNNFCCSGNYTTEISDNPTQNFSLKSFRKISLNIEGDFYVTIKEL